MLKTPRFLLAACILLALVLTFSCSGDDGDGPPATLPSSSSDAGVSQLPSSPSVALSSSSEEELVEISSSSEEEIPESSSSSATAPPYIPPYYPPNPPVTPSSSSLEPSSSSYYCSHFMEGEQRFHLGKDKHVFCDKRDGHEYVYVEIGTQKWMAENLNYNAEGSIVSICTNEDPEEDCHVYPYGRLYDWITAMKLPAECSNKDCKNEIEPNHQGICPEGWHIPANNEWAILENYALTGTGQNRTGFEKLIANPGWDYSVKNRDGVVVQYYENKGTDDYGLALLPGGEGSKTDAPLYSSYIGATGAWWAATDNVIYASQKNITYNSGSWNISTTKRKYNVASVRCLKTESH